LEISEPRTRRVSQLKHFGKYTGYLGIRFVGVGVYSEFFELNIVSDVFIVTLAQGICPV
jgi:hypothetical protein